MAEVKTIKIIIEGVGKIYFIGNGLKMAAAVDDDNDNDDDLAREYGKHYFWKR